MLKYLYVLVSDNNDYYLENALLSMFSLKMRMPNAYISLLCDKDTEKTFIGLRKNILDFADEVTIPQIEDSFNKKQRSRWLKTSMRNHVAGDFLYIDCDTVIADGMEELSGLDINIGAVLDVHCGVNEREPLIVRWLQQRDKRLGFESSLKTNTYFNSGVIFCKDTAVCHNFFDKWHTLWLYSNSMGCTEDQPSFNQTNFLFNGIIMELDGIWNCQICSPGMVPYLYGSKIIHYFISGKLQRGFYKLAEPAVFEKIKETGCVSEETKELLKTSRQAFTNDSIFCGISQGNDFLLSASFVFFNGLYKRKIIKWLDAPLQVLLDIYTYFKYTIKKNKRV